MAEPYVFTYDGRISHFTEWSVRFETDRVITKEEFQEILSIAIKNGLYPENFKWNGIKVHVDVYPEIEEEFLVEGEPIEDFDFNEYTED